MANLLTKLRISEVSSVDKGAGEGVQILLMKGSKMKKTLFEAVKARLGFGGTVADSLADAGASLHKSVADIIADASLDQAAKTAAVGDRFTKFAEHLDGTIPASIAEALGDAGLVSVQPTHKGHDIMDEKLAAELAAVKADLAKARIDLAKAGMTDKHRQFMADTDMDEDDKAAFVAKSPEERDAHMTKNPAEKRLPESVQKQLAEFAQLKKTVGELTMAKRASDFAKRADDAGLPADMGDVLHKALHGDEAERTASITKIWDMLATSVAKEADGNPMFKEFGGRGDGGGATVDQELMAKAAELRKVNPALSQEQAFARVYQDPANADLAKRERRTNRPG